MGVQAPSARARVGCKANSRQGRRRLSLRTKGGSGGPRWLRRGRAKASHHPPSVRRVSRAVPLMLLSVRHIGPRRAERLVDGLGDRWVELIDADPERVFGTLRGMGRRRARIAAASWRELTSPAAADGDRGIAAPRAP